jgi:hypothetical protein
MIGFDRTISRLLFLASLCWAMAGGSAAFGQDDDVIDDAIRPVPAQPRGAMELRMLPPVAAQFNPEQIDQWVFNRWGGADGARARLDANLALQIDDLDRACELTEIQKKKVMLAGLGDIKRYYDRVDELKRRYAAGTNQGNFNNIWQEMQPLQVELGNGLFGDDSLFVKTVKSTLNSDQLQRHDDLMRRRVAARRRASVDLFVVQIDKALGLSATQRERLTELLVSETPAPAKYGQADYWYLMYEMTRLPESKITKILDEPQWRLLGRQFMQARGMEPWLKSNGIIAGGKESRPPTRAIGVEMQGEPMRIFVAPPVPVRVGGAGVKK